MLPGFSGKPNLGSPWPCGRQAVGSHLGCANDLGLAACCHHISWRSAADASPAALLRHDRGQFIKHAPAQFLGPDCQAPALVIAKTEPLASELFAQHAVLLLQIVDHILLALV